MTEQSWTTDDLDRIGDADEFHLPPFRKDGTLRPAVPIWVVVFAMANPTPEVEPEDVSDYVRIMATGRSDYPNQINNVLAFPGVFRGSRRARHNDQRGDEAGRRPGDRLDRLGRRARCRVHHPPRVQPDATARSASRQRPCPATHPPDQPTAEGGGRFLTRSGRT